MESGLICLPAAHLHGGGLWGGGGNDDAGSELAELMHAFGVPVRTGDREVLDIQSEYMFSEMRLYLLILEMVEEDATMDKFMRY